MIKKFCYSSSCGPAKLTGFNIEQYWVCTSCKEEITERLKNEIDDRLAGKAVKQQTEDEDDSDAWKFYD